MTRVAFVTNLCPFYRRPLFELLAEELQTTFFFFSDGEESYLSPAVQHVGGRFPVGRVRRISVAGNPLLVGLAGELRRQRYDVVVKCLDGRLMVPYVYGLSRARGIPLVLWSGMWHHPHTRAHRLTRPLVENIYRGADAIVAYGAHVKQFVEMVDGVAPEKVYVAGQAVDSAPYAGIEPTFGEPPEVLFVGRLEEDKGIDDLLSAFASVKAPRARLRIAGVGSLEARVRAQAELDSRIEVCGQLPNADLPHALERARCLVLPSVTTNRFRETWGIIVNEAMSAGVPVVATDAVGAAAGGLLTHGRNGFVVPEGRPEALAAAIQRLVSDPSLARLLGHQARIDVAAFSYPRMTRAFVDAIEHAISTSYSTGRARL